MNVVKIDSFERVDEALLEMGRCEARRSKAEAAMNEKIQKIREEYNSKVKEDIATYDELKDKISDFCAKNKSAFEKDKRSRELIHGTVGFRTSPPSVKQLNNKFKVATSLELIKKLWSKRKDLFIRTKEEINKDAILAEYISKDKLGSIDPAELKAKLDDEKLAAVGLRVDQDESFTFEIKWDTLDSEAA